MRQRIPYREDKQVRDIRKYMVFSLFIFAVMLFPISASAQDELAISPTEWDFGDVEIGSSSTQIFTLTNVDGASVSVSRIDFREPVDGSCVWPMDLYTGDSFTASHLVPPLPPITIPMEGYGDPSFDLSVTFAPLTLGNHFVCLYIRSNACIGGENLIPIKGKGVTEEKPTSEIMAELIDDFNLYVGEGSICGSGPGASASGRLKAFGNMLKASSDLILAGDYETACVQLQDALNRVDGEEPPPDFVAGDNREELANGIVEVMNALGCP